MSQNLNWKECTTLSKQTRQGCPVARSFGWAEDTRGTIYIRASRKPQTFGRQDYEAMIAHVNAHPQGVSLGARRDGTVPSDSLGALMEQRRNTSSIRCWCSHLAAIAVQRGDITFEDRGRGPGRGVWLYPVQEEKQR